MSAFKRDDIEALNLITSSDISRLYKDTEREDPLELRRKAADFRKGYKNWRQKKPKGARGETNYLLDSQKEHASTYQDDQQQLLQDAADEVEEILASAAPGLGITRSTSFSAVVVPPKDAKLVRRPSFHGEEEIIHVLENENWLKFYVNPYSGMAEAGLTEPVDLTQQSLGRLPQNVVKPFYARPTDQPFVDFYMCHMGVGGFHRSHQCEYTDDLLNRAARSSGNQSKRWGICGVGLMPWDVNMYEALKSQDHLYTLLSRGNSTNEARVIGAIVDFVYAPEDHQACIQKLAHDTTRIVSLTVTEKGYCQNVDGDLDLENPMVKSDLESDLLHPKTAIGMIVAGLRARFRQKMLPFTVLSCDNLPENGDKIEHVVLQMAQAVDPVLADWIKENVTFPNTMVDRITPMTEQEHKDILARDHMVIDKWPVIAEDFRQWVIEDKFCNGRPDWDEVGALFVKDVKPYEFMKLRLLNGGHSALSYTSYLCGFHYVDDAMNDVTIRSFISSYFCEMKPTLLPVPGVDTDDYCNKLLERFSNPYIKDKLLRLAEDGSKKMQNTMRDAVLELCDSGRTTKAIAFANAAWIRFCYGTDELGQPIEVKDPMADELHLLAKKVIQNPELCDPTEFLRKVHGDALAKRSGFVGEVQGFLQDMMRSGARKALEGLMDCACNPAM